MKRVVFYAPLKLIRNFKSKLAAEGLSMSEWFRREAQKYLDSEE